MAEGDKDKKGAELGLDPSKETASLASNGSSSTDIIGAPKALAILTDALKTIKEDAASLTAGLAAPAAEVEHEPGEPHPGPKIEPHVEGHQVTALKTGGTGAAIA